MKFTSSTAGQVTALKFYRSANDNGPDVLDLWSATGTKLASATFTNTSASGWQTVALATPVPISANTTYVASYHTTAPMWRPPITLPARSRAARSQRPRPPTVSMPMAGPARPACFRRVRGAPPIIGRMSYSRRRPRPTPRNSAIADTGSAAEKGGVANGLAGSSAAGNVLTNNTDCDTGEREIVTAVGFGATAGTPGTVARPAPYGECRSGSRRAPTAYTINETDAAVQALRLSTNTLSDVVQLQRCVTPPAPRPRRRSTDRRPRRQ